MQRLLLAAAVISLAGCTTYKLYSETDSNQEEGVIQLSYEYGRLETPQVDERQGLDLARQRCKDWGYPDAQRRGEERACIDGTKTDCARWQVTREYRCAAR